MQRGDCGGNGGGKGVAIAVTVMGGGGRGVCHGIGSGSSNLLGTILMIVHNFYKRQKEVASTSILCEFAHHGVQSCSSDITLQWVHGIEFLQLNHDE